MDLNTGDRVYVASTGNPPAGYSPEPPTFVVSPTARIGLVALRQCHYSLENHRAIEHFLSIDPLCEGMTEDATLGYVSASGNAAMGQALLRCYDIVQARTITAHRHWSSVSRVDCERPEGVMAYVE